MPGTYTLRAARPEDGAPIHRLLQETWKEPLLFDVFMDHIASETHQITVAVEAGEIAGFVSAFLVPLPTPRWEIDLIMVGPTSRGKGVGTALIQKALTYGPQFGVSWAKASIRTDNVPSQRAFAKAGFTTEGDGRRLLLWEPLPCRPADTDLPKSVHLIPVDTLLYRGVWIEGFFESELPPTAQQRVIRAARNVAFQGNRLNTGMFTPDRLKQSIAPNLLTTATDFGQYHWWEYEYR